MDIESICNLTNSSPPTRRGTLRGSRRKACIITTVHPPFDTRIFHKQAKTLVKAGYDVALIVQHERDEVVSGVRIMALPKSRNKLVRMNPVKQL